MLTVPVTLEQMLDARELRAAHQQALLTEHGLPLLCIGMNIAGPVKDSPLIRAAFRTALSRCCCALGTPVSMQTLYLPTGPEGYLVYDLSPTSMKQRVCAIEEADTLGRLFDLDVLDAQGHKLSREGERSCLVCGGPAFVCARERAHGLAAVTERTKTILYQFAAEELARLACEALVQEVHVTPKPGLVDENNNGAHSDMDLFLFEQSAAALQPYFFEACKCCLTEGAKLTPLRSIGIEAERAMLNVTRGVNTHKGAIYSFLIYLGGLSQYLLEGGELSDKIRSLASTELERIPKNTHGAVSRGLGVNGARSEAANAFPTARKALSCLETEPPTLVLLEILCQLDDTNVLYRGGEAGLSFMRENAKRILALPPSQQEAALLRFDSDCIKKNLSPGGSADVLALALLMRCAEALFL